MRVDEAEQWEVLWSTIKRGRKRTKAGGGAPWFERGGQGTEEATIKPEPHRVNNVLSEGNTEQTP